MDFGKNTRNDMSFNVVYNSAHLPILFCKRDSNYLREHGGQFLNHWHADLEFVFVIEGSISYTVNGKEVILHQDEGIMINCRRIHSISPDGDNYGRYYLLIFHPSLFSHATKELNAYVSTRFSMGNRDFFILDRSVDSQRETLNKIAAFDSIFNADPTNPVRILACILDICADMCEYSESLESNTRDNRMQLSYIKMIDYIKVNYSENITVDDIAKAGNVSRATCNQLFRKYTDQTTNSYLMTYRVEKFASMLRDTTLPIVDIAVSCGFRSPNYCFGLFKREYGVTPNQYRESFFKREYPEH